MQNIPPSARTDGTFLSTFRAFFPSPQTSASSSLLSPASRRMLDDADRDSSSAVPHFIHSAYVAKDTGDMAEWAGERNEALNGLEHALLQLQLKPDERPMTATKFFCCAKRDALEHWEETLVEREKKMAEQKRKAEGTDGWPAGFITFESVVAYQSAARVDPTAESSEWTCRPAPELRDVYWPSLSYTATKRLYMGIVVGILLWMLVLLWTIPVTFVQGIANLSSLPASGGAVGSAFQWINSIPSGALALIDGFLPGLVLTVFNILLPMMLYKLSKLQGVEAWSWLQASVIRKFTIFQIANNFFFSMASTAFLADISDITSNPTGIVTVLAANIPQTGTFFITYLLFTTFAVYPMALLNPGGLIVGRLKKRFTMKTPRDVVAIEAAPSRDYGTSYPITLFTFIIAITFSVLASISLPFAVLYFAIGYFVSKVWAATAASSHTVRRPPALHSPLPCPSAPPCQYNHLYVYDTAFETGRPAVARRLPLCHLVHLHRAAVVHHPPGPREGHRSRHHLRPSGHPPVALQRIHTKGLRAPHGGAAAGRGQRGGRREGEEAREGTEGCGHDGLPGRLVLPAGLRPRHRRHPRHEDRGPRLPTQHRYSAQDGDLPQGQSQRRTAERRRKKAQ